MDELIERLRRHKKHPNAPDHFRFMLDDLILYFEVQAECSTPEGLEKRMTALEKALNDAVGNLSTKLAEHDSQVQKTLEALSAASAAGDQSGVQAAVDAISAASGKIAEETAAMAAALPKPTDPAAPAAGTDPAGPTA
jgi:hypothetical protein